MRRLIVICCCLFAFGARAQDAERIFVTAEKLYKEDKFKDAIREYQILENREYTGKELFYNMGNCYYKTGQLGMAIAYYEKALKCDPADEDIKANLRLVNSKIEDKINDEEKGLAAWFKRFIHILPADRWTKIGIILWLLGFLGLVLAKINLVKKTRTMSISSWLGIVFGVFALSFGFINYKMTNRHNTAVITEAMVQVKSLPSVSAKNLYILHEGAKVFLHKTNDAWYEISIDNENYGWVKKEDAEVI